MATYDGNGLRITYSTSPSETELEELIEKYPHMLLDEPLTIIGRQHTNADGKRPDLLAVDENGNLVVIELKKGRAEREILAQTAEYLAWARELDEQDVNAICAGYRNDADEAASYFLNPDGFDVRAVMLATFFDPETARALKMFAEYGLPIEARYYGIPSTGGIAFDDEPLIERAPRSRVNRPTPSAQRGEWDGVSYYHILGFSGPRSRRISDALKFGFVSSADWADAVGKPGTHTGLLAQIPIGATVYAYGKTIEGAGYYGFGLVEQAARPASEVEIAGVSFYDLPLDGQYAGSDADHDDGVEYVAVVRWVKSRDLDDLIPAAVTNGAQQKPCKLYDGKRLPLRESFGVAD
jgi:hypothetical protein